MGICSGEDDDETNSELYEVDEEKFRAVQEIVFEHSVSHMIALITTIFHQTKHFDVLRFSDQSDAQGADTAVRMTKEELSEYHGFIDANTDAIAGRIAHIKAADRKRLEHVRQVWENRPIVYRTAGLNELSYEDIYRVAEFFKYTTSAPPDRPASARPSALHILSSLSQQQSSLRTPSEMSTSSASGMSSAQRMPTTEAPAKG
jgi:hypothetical protein